MHAKPYSNRYKKSDEVDYSKLNDDEIFDPLQISQIKPKEINYYYYDDSLPLWRVAKFSRYNF